MQAWAATMRATPASLPQFLKFKVYSKQRFAGP